MNLTITPNFTQSKNNQRLNILAFAAQKPNLPANSNLAPLARDTVSFGGKASGIKKVVGAIAEATTDLRANKIAEEGPNVFNYQMACDLEREAEIPMGYFQNTLFRYLRKHISADMGDDRIIQRLDFRIKSRDSINEKFKSVAKDLSEEELVNLTKVDANNMIGDIIAGRIVLRDDSKKSVRKILQILGQIVKDGKLKFTEIESYYPVVTSIPDNILKAFRKDLGLKFDDKQLREITKPGYFSYADSKDVIALSEVSRSTYPDLVVKAGQDLPNGYQALHLNGLLPDGSKFEIQVIGRDVEVLKSIEDYVYKAKCKKRVKIPALAERLAPLGDKNEKALRSEHIDYTRYAYIGQRLKGQQSYKTKTSERFLTAPQSILDRGLGYNQLIKLKNMSSSK